MLLSGIVGRFPKYFRIFIYYFKIYCFTVFINSEIINSNNTSFICYSINNNTDKRVQINNYLNYFRTPGTDYTNFNLLKSFMRFNRIFFHKESMCY